MAAPTTAEITAHTIFSERIQTIPRSFIREILKTALEPGMISFAGGLPNKDLFPVEALRIASEKVFRTHGGDPLQYTSSEGLPELRAYIADRYKKRGVKGVSPDDILITSGSQQALDLLGKVLINEGDRVILEEPSYLGAIQALAFFRPTFKTVPLTEEGLDIPALAEALATPAKLMYIIPNFQNPSGISYSKENREQVAEVVKKTRTYIVEDNPYGELRFRGEPQTSFKNLAPDNTVLLGTFSKTLTPGLRIGWIVAPPALMDKLLIAKQAADLHTSSFAQRLVHTYLVDNDPDVHIAKIVAQYASQQMAMTQAIEKYLPSSIKTTRPEGGMFLWATLPNGISSMKLSDAAIANKVCVVPGHPFYVGKKDVSTFRLSFSCVDAPTIDEGMKRLAKAVRIACPDA
ncbi:MAG: PLP-dependent aminotransferase family protein [Alphaproteobacteria bacterium]|nr:PLP-dependent aminotransferase family protein [Alphaproteobacteria bacterium]